MSVLIVQFVINQINEDYLFFYYFLLQLVNNKCIPALLYGLEACACPLNETDFRSLDFSVNHFNAIIQNKWFTDHYGMSIVFWFGFQLPSVRLSERSKRFHVKYAASKISLIYWRTYRPNSHTCLLCSHCFLYQLSFKLLLYIALL